MRWLRELPGASVAWTSFVREALAHPQDKRLATEEPERGHPDVAQSHDAQGAGVAAHGEFGNVADGNEKRHVGLLGSSAAAKPV